MVNKPPSINHHKPPITDSECFINFWTPDFLPMTKYFKFPLYFLMILISLRHKNQPTPNIKCWKIIRFAAEVQYLSFFFPPIHKMQAFNLVLITDSVFMSDHYSNFPSIVIIYLNRCGSENILQGNQILSHLVITVVNSCCYCNIFTK